MLEVVLFTTSTNQASEFGKIKGWVPSLKQVFEGQGSLNQRYVLQMNSISVIWNLEPVKYLGFFHVV
jgi:hypothetical protein